MLISDFRFSISELFNFDFGGMLTQKTLVILNVVKNLI